MNYFAFLVEKPEDSCQEKRYQDDVDEYFWESLIQYKVAGPTPASIFGTGETETWKKVTVEGQGLIGPKYRLVP